MNATVPYGETYTTKANNSAGIPAYEWRCTDPAGCMAPYILAELAVPTAVFTGGGGTVTYVWGGACTGTATNDATCEVNDATTCAATTLDVKVSDAICGLSNNPTGTYGKVTTVTTSVNNP